MSELKHMIQLYADFTWDEHLAYEAETRVRFKEEAYEREKAAAKLSATALRLRLRYEVFFVFSAETSLLIFPRFEMINVINSHMTPLTPKPDPISIQHIKNMERIRKRLAEE